MQNKSLLLLFANLQDCSPALFKSLKNKEILIMSSKHYTYAEMIACLDLLKNKQINISRLITAFTKHDDLCKVIEATLNADIMRGVITFDDD